MFFCAFNLFLGENFENMFEKPLSGNPIFYEFNFSALTKLVKQAVMEGVVKTECQGNSKSFFKTAKH